MTEPGFDTTHAVRRIERGLEWFNFAAGTLLVTGALVVAIRWRMLHGGFHSLRAFYLHTAWALGATLLLAAFALRRGWRSRWIFQLLPLAVPVVAAQWFIARFIAPIARIP